MARTLPTNRGCSAKRRKSGPRFRVQLGFKGFVLLWIRGCGFEFGRSRASGFWVCLAAGRVKDCSCS